MCEGLKKKNMFDFLTSNISFDIFYFQLYTLLVEVDLEHIITGSCRSGRPTVLVWQSVGCCVHIHASECW